MYAEYAPVSQVYFTWWPGYHDAFFAGIVAAVVQHGNAGVTLVVEDAAHQADIAAELAARSIDTTNVSYADISAYPFYDGPWSSGALDSYWFVDYGPFWVTDGAGTLGTIDPRYYPDRTNDDAVPAKLAHMEGLSIFRPDLNLEGGNLTSDGDGTCVLTRAHQLRNLPLFPYEVDEILYDYFGCDQVIWLEPLVGEPTGHHDMFCKQLTPDTFIVGEYTAAQDAENAAILDINAQRLASASNTSGQPFQVVRIPMPDPGSSWWGGTVWRTYTNSILVNDLVLVPTYADETPQEAAALAVYQSVLPSATVVGVDADDIITEGGAIHCVTRTRPTATATTLEAPPGQQCGGDWDCPPTGCGALDPTGICIGEVAAWCDSGEVQSEHCSGGEVCGWDESSVLLDCVGAGCGGVTPQGRCELVDGVEFAVWCDGDGYPRGQRCMAFETCGPELDLGRVACLDQPPPCTHDCAAGEAGCTADATATWSCGEAGDGDPCRERIVTACDPDEVCENGVDATCTCVDECAYHDSGCNAEATEAWTCEEAGDGDDCLERIRTVCAADEVCEVDPAGRALCACVDECSTGETGCASDLGARWTCGEAGDGDGCLERITEPCGSEQLCRDGECEPERRPLTPGGCGCGVGPGGGPDSDPGSGLPLLPWVVLGMLGLLGLQRRRWTR
jgi:agmatine/peptidylarginine deiminase